MKNIVSLLHYYMMWSKYLDWDVDSLSLAFSEALSILDQLKNDNRFVLNSASPMEPTFVVSFKTKVQTHIKSSIVRYYVTNTERRTLIIDLKKHIKNYCSASASAPTSTSATS